MTPDEILASLSQLDHQKRPVTRVAIILFTLMCLSLGGLQAWNVYRAREVRLQDATVAAANVTRSMADHAANTLNTADALLAEIAERVQSEGALLDTMRMERYLSERVRRTAVLSDLHVYDEHAKLVLGTGDPGAAAPAIADDWRVRFDTPASYLHLATPRRHPASGEWVLPLSRRLSRPDGSFAGVVSANLRIRLLKDFYHELEAGHEATLLVALTSGQLVLRRPGIDQDIGKDIRSGPLFQSWYRDPANGSAFVTSGPAGQQRERLYSYRRLKQYPLLVGVAIPTDVILADWWQTAYLSTAGVSLLFLIQLWLGVRLYGQVTLRDRLEKERRRLQKLLLNKGRSLRSQAMQDALTGVANRRQFDTRLQREFARAAASERPIALVMLDVDFFKKYNDQYGHPAGDECLKVVAACLNSGRRRTPDLAARLGGEEFAILLPDTGLRGAIAVAEAVRKAVAGRTLEHVPGQPHSVTISCGVHALVPRPGMTPADLVDGADRALYLAKTSGRNRVRAEGSMPPASGERFTLVVNK